MADDNNQQQNQQKQKGGGQQAKEGLTCNTAFNGGDMHSLDDVKLTVKKTFVNGLAMTVAAGFAGALAIFLNRAFGIKGPVAVDPAKIDPKQVKPGLAIGIINANPNDKEFLRKVRENLDRLDPQEVVEPAVAE
jgi:hypothetical protein